MSIIINLNEQKEITGVTLGDDLQLSYSDLFDICGSLLGLTCVTILNQRAQAPDYTEEQSTKDRAALYDNLVLLISMLSETIYPEYKDIKGNPEDFLKYLDSKSKALKDLEDKVNVYDSIIGSLYLLDDNKLHSLARDIRTQLADRSLNKSKEETISAT